MLSLDFLYETTGAHFKETGCWLLAQLLGGLAGGLLFRYLYWREYQARYAYLSLRSEHEGAEVGSFVGGNENAGKLVKWGPAAQKHHMETIATVAAISNAACA